MLIVGYCSGDHATRIAKQVTVCEARVAFQIGKSFPHSAGMTNEQLPLLQAAACAARDMAEPFCMPNPQLTAEQREALFEPLFASTKTELERLSGGDSQVLWALRRKLTKELGYLERGSPQERAALKRRKMQEQKGLCEMCRQKLPVSGAHLHRLIALNGYTDKNTQLVHPGCHTSRQRRAGYASR